MNHKPTARWSDRWVDFVFGFLLGIAVCLGGVMEGRDHSRLVGETLLIGLIVGTITALFGRKAWRWWSRLARRL